MKSLIAVLREPFLRIIRAIQRDPPFDDFPVQWALATQEAKSLSLTLAIARRNVNN